MIEMSGKSGCYTISATSRGAHCTNKLKNLHLITLHFIELYYSNELYYIEEYYIK